MVDLLIENEVQQIEDSTNRDVLDIVVEHIEHILLDFVGFVDGMLEAEAVIQELGERVGTI